MNYELFGMKSFEIGVVCFYFLHLCLDVSVGDDGLCADDFPLFEVKALE